MSIKRNQNLTQIKTFEKWQIPDDLKSRNHDIPAHLSMREY